MTARALKLMSFTAFGAGLSRVRDGTKKLTGGSATTALQTGAPWSRLKTVKLTEADIQERLDYLEEVKTTGLELDAESRIEDFGTFELFKYFVQGLALITLGVTVQHLPAAEASTSQDHNRMNNLFESYFNQPHINPDALFEGCKNVRDKIARLTELTESQLVLIYDDLSIEYVVRKYAGAMLAGDIDDMHKILDQSLGKPLEQRLTVNQDISLLADCTEDQLKEMLRLTSGEPIKAEAQVEDIERKKDEQAKG
jgi:hypothetical protein